MGPDFLDIIINGIINGTGTTRDWAIGEKNKIMLLEHIKHELLTGHPNGTIQQT